MAGKEKAEPGRNNMLFDSFKILLPNFKLMQEAQSTFSDSLSEQNIEAVTIILGGKQTAPSQAEQISTGAQTGYHAKQPVWKGLFVRSRIHSVGASIAKKYILSNNKPAVC